MAFAILVLSNFFITSMGRRRPSEHTKAVREVRKALKWMIASGALLVLLNTLQELLQALQNGSMDWKQVGIGVIYAVAFAAINTAIYYLHSRGDFSAF